MKFLSDLFPVLLFFAVYSFSRNIYLATSAAIAATALQVVWSLIRHRKVDTMLWVSFALIVVLGGATLLLHDKHFIMWKPTVLYWIMGGGLLIGQMAGKNGIRAMIGKQVELPDTVWRKLCYAWSAFFLLVGAINLFVAYRFSEAVWVNFKMFGVLGLLVVFAIAQSLALSRYVKED
ncbi:MAG: septation protein A [Paludibacterium sp.]|uniref:septation protein A n=1 Tax=Paludibacterium sp. TaxID=1917523 RepID=UPI0025FFAB5F|nr:septation protein A [Paludibacterium sp.]MBV8048859.1 septation protein A [Paludibacterium sp.]MBV8646484.1 septation protein A [Paludibacterium sp.]